MRVAVGQMSSGTNPSENLAQALDIVQQAADAQVRLLVLPENMDYMGSDAGVAGIASTSDGDFSAALSAKARELGMWIVAGSIHEKRPDTDKVRNTSQLFAPDGSIAATYSKTHLFDVALDTGFSFLESATVEAGPGTTLADVDGVGVGMSICYDLRFPELFRSYAVAGARILVVPAAFTAHTGAAHWEVLLRARAIENQVFVLAAGQIGAYEPSGASFGHSMIIDPWGEVLANAGDAPGGTLAVADLTFERLDAVRQQIPALANRRPDIYSL